MQLLSGWLVATKIQGHSGLSVETLLWRDNSKVFNLKTLYFIHIWSKEKVSHEFLGQKDEGQGHLDISFHTSLLLVLSNNFMSI